jgi:hypothetical protein
MKPYRGRIENWRKISYHNGDVIVGEFWGQHDSLHVTGGGRPLRTSLLVKFTPTHIETLNSRYDLGKPFDEHRNLGA